MLKVGDRVRHKYCEISGTGTIVEANKYDPGPVYFDYDDPEGPHEPHFYVMWDGATRRILHSANTLVKVTPVEELAGVIFGRV